jgi:Membrane-associated phospholipid phosphatase
MTPRNRRREVAIAALLVLYAALTVLVLLPRTFLLTFDSWCLHLNLIHKHAAWWPWIHSYVEFGQRGPATLTFLPFFFWVAWRERSTKPLVLLAVGLLWLNFSVGVAKYAIGRVGPYHQSNVHDLFVWGNSIYPSGHVSNAVVLYGLIAWIAPRYRKTLITIAVFLSVTVGLGTVYLRTHWISDVFGGWVAGALVLLTVPYFMPTAQRLTDWAIYRGRLAWQRRSVGIPEPVAPGAAVPVRQRIQRVPTPAAPRHLVTTVSARKLVDDPARMP